MSQVCPGCGNYLTEGADCPDCTMSDALVRVTELEAIRNDDHRQILSLQGDCDRYRMALEQIANASDDHITELDLIEIATIALKG